MSQYHDEPLLIYNDTLQPCLIFGKNVTALERALYVYALGPLVVVGLVGGLLFLLVSLSSSPKAASKKVSKTLVTAHFYVYIYACVLWDILACLNFVFFPLLYYAIPTFAIFNPSLFTYTTKVSFYVEQVCAFNVNWITTALSIDRLIALFAPFTYVNAITRVRAERWRWLRFCTLSLPIILAIGMCGLLLSIPYAFYVDVKRAFACPGGFGINSKSDIDGVYSKFFYYYEMSSFYHTFSPKFDKFFSVIVYLLPTILIFLANCAILVGLYMRRRVTEFNRSQGIPKTAPSNILHMTEPPDITHTKNADNSFHIKESKFNKIRNSHKLDEFHFLRSQLHIAPTNSVNPMIKSGSVASANETRSLEVASVSSSVPKLNKYFLTVGISAQFIILNLPYVTYVFISSSSWIQGSEGPMANAQVYVNLLKYSNHTFTVLSNIFFNREFIMLLSERIKGISQCIRKVITEA